MTEYVIELYETFLTKGCTDELIFSNFNDQPIPSDYYNFLKDDDDDGNNVPINPVYNDLPENEGVEDEVMTNNEDINNYIIIIDDDDSLAPDIDPPQN